MILSAPQKLLSAQAITKLQKAAPSVYERIVDATVKLEGGIFTATGVVAEASKSQVVIVTAAHNVDTYCRGAHVDHHPLATMIRSFLTNVTITLSSGGEKVTAHATSALPSSTSTKTGNEISGHDVIRLVIEDAPFRYVVHRMLARMHSSFQLTRALNPVFPAPDLWHDQDTGAVTLASRDNWNNVMTVQVGFGSKNENDDPPAGFDPQVRALEAATFSYRAVTQQAGGVYFDHILHTAATANNTTWTGDSGGPLFTVDLTDNKKPVLMGVTLGSNFSQDNMADNPVRDNSISLYQPSTYNVDKAKEVHYLGRVLDGARFSSGAGVRRP